MIMDTAKSYTVAMDFRHEDEWVRPGDKVKLSEEDARQRLADGQIRPLPGQKGSSGPKGDPKTGSNAADASARS
jgi:hypothetical protein